MRYGLVVLAIAAAVGLGQGWLARIVDDLTTAALSEDARVAIDVRCGDQVGRSAHECRSMLKKLYLSGSLDPDKTLRTYCDAVKTARWGGSLPPAPEVCVERYGGWQQI